jgi:DNA processing protein
MHNDELLYRIGITMIHGVGDVLAKNLIAYCGSAEAVFKENKSRLLRIPGFGDITAESVLKSKVLQRAEAEIKFIENNNIRPLFFTDEAYPTRLKHCADSPVMLYYKGTADLNAERMISIVGTRNPTRYGKKLVEDLIGEMRDQNIIVVSGLAYGIDISAHKLSLDAGLQTIGVVAHGLDRIYPQIHSPVAEKMKTQGGLLTDFMSETNPDRENFPKRNRIVAGLCDALIVIESRNEGGSLITAEIANSYSKDVFAFPGRIEDPFSGGCNRLIKRHKAALIESYADLVYIMGWEKKEEKKKKSDNQIPMLLNLSDEEQKIVSTLQGKEKVHIDEICSTAELPVSKASSLLLQLEFSNLVRSLPGKMYAMS